ncbi:MAG: hypothetical protein BWY78_01220 [Alphaproteobacteria bacterium ADurb.Bin438]|nr:MAG: hypothetical protein BWY78_01220 [Alphaproteobacteria bacterium ADurb.Bin438]
MKMLCVIIMKTVRIFGVLLTFLSVLTASAEAVIAFGGDTAYESLFTSEVCEIILGNEVVAESFFTQILLSLPAWVFFGSLGIFMIFVSRFKKNRGELAYNRFYRNF